MLLLCFPIIVTLSYGAIYKCSDRIPSFLVFLVIVFFSVILTQGKGANFGKWLKLSYPFLVLFSFYIISPLFSGTEISAPNSKIKAYMNQMRSTAELVNIKSGSYAGIRDSADFKALLTTVRETRMRIDQMCFIDLLDKNKMRESPDAESLLIAPDGSAWCYRSALLNNPIPWCVDSMGYMGNTDAGGCNKDNLSCGNK
jgi:hypothetical protein